GVSTMQDAWLCQVSSGKISSDSRKGASVAAHTRSPPASIPVAKSANSARFSGRWMFLELLTSFYLSQHLVDPCQRRVHHLFARTDFRRRHRVVGAVTSLGGGLDGREVLMIAVAIAEKEQLFHARPL